MEGATRGFAQSVLSGGDISQIFTNTITGGLNAQITGQLPDILNNGDHGFSFGLMLGHGIVQGVFSAIRGGKFKTGFISGAASKITSATINETPLSQADPFVKMSVTAILSGMASKASGGDFVQGAMSAMVVWLYNEAGHGADRHWKPKTSTYIIGVSVSYDGGNSGTAETGMFFSTVVDKKGKATYYKGKYYAFENGAGVNYVTGADSSLNLTFGKFNTGFNKALIGFYTNTGGDAGLVLDVGGASLNSLDGETHGVTINIGFSTPEASSHITVGKGWVYDVQVKTASGWTPCDTNCINSVGN